MRFNLSEWALDNRSLVAYFMIVAVAAGVLSYFRLGRNEDPTFIIKTMVVQAAWPGATIEDTLKQVTERLERTLEETPKLDFLRSYTSPGLDDDLRQSEGRYHCARGEGHLVRRSHERGRHAPYAPGGHRGARLQRQLRRYVRDHLRLHGPGLHSSRASGLRGGRPLEALEHSRRVQDRDPRRPGREDLRRVLDEGAGQPRRRPLGAHRGAAGAERGASGRDDPDRRRDAVASRVGRFPVGAGSGERQLRRRRPHAALERHCADPASLLRSPAAAFSRQRRAGHRACDRDARGRGHSGAGKQHQAGDGQGNGRASGRNRAEAGRGSGGDSQDRHLRVHDLALAGHRHHPGRELHQPGRAPGTDHRAFHSLDARRRVLGHGAQRHRHAAHLARCAHHRAGVARRRRHDDHGRDASLVLRRATTRWPPQPSPSGRMPFPCSPARW